MRKQQQPLAATPVALAEFEDAPLEPIGRQDPRQPAAAGRPGSRGSSSARGQQAPAVAVRQQLASLQAGPWNRRQVIQQIRRDRWRSGSGTGGNPSGVWPLVSRTSPHQQRTHQRQREHRQGIDHRGKTPSALVGSPLQAIAAATVQHHAAARPRGRSPPIGPLLPEGRHSTVPSPPVGHRWDRLKGGAVFFKPANFHPQLRRAGRRAKVRPATLPGPAPRSGLPPR